MTINYRVVDVHDGAVEVWDGQSKIEPDHPARSTMMLPVERASKFEVGDLVDIVVILRERPPKPEEL